MKMVVAYIRHEAFEPIRQDLLGAGFPSLSITEVKGSGRQKGITEHYRGSEITIHLRPKLKIECVVDDGTGSLLAVFLGRRELGGVRPGARVELTGTAGVHKDRLAILNPDYRLLAAG